MAKKTNKNKKGMSIHVPHKIFFILITIVLSFAGYFLYNHYYTYYYDSSTNGSEIIEEIKHSTVPPDVKQAMQQAPLHVLSATTFRVPILMYHYVEYVQDKGDTTRISLNTPPYILEEEIKTLLQAGYTFITNAELADALDGKIKLPPQPILLTFDDGYEDFYTDVLPILKKYNVKATAYLISGFLNRPNHLTDSQVQEIIQSGIVEIGAHTVHHAWLKGRNLQDITHEAAQSKVMLEQQFNIHIASFAYPFGAFDKQSLDVIKSVGFRTATSTIPGIEQNQQNRYFLCRLRSGGRTGQSLLNWLNQDKFSAY